MNVDARSVGRVLANELPGLLGVLQPGAGAAQNPAEAARRQGLANAMLAAAAGLLTPSPNRYPLGPLQRLGAGLGAALESLDAAPPSALFQTSGGEAAGQGSATEGAARKKGRVLAKVAAPAAAAGQRPSKEPHRAGSRGAGRLARQRGPALRKFNGSLGRRLEHPAVLPGGWQLYGYEAKSGNPVYAGPGRELRVYLGERE